MGESYVQGRPGAAVDFDYKSPPSAPKNTRIWYLNCPLLVAQRVWKCCNFNNYLFSLNTKPRTKESCCQ